LLVSATDPGDHQKIYASLNFRVYSGPGVAPPYDVVDPDLADEVTKGVPDFNRALCALAENDRDSALRWFKVALMRNPSNEVARSRLAQLYYDKQQYADVAALFARSPVTRETDEEAILRGADSIARTGSVPRAISLLEDALHIRGNSGPLYLALAGYYRNEGDTEKATQLESRGRELIKQ
jgi:Tfp pilus assembly protein PilF